MPAASEPTIAAIATPPGPGGIGVIRLSGTRSLAIATELFRAKRRRPLQSHRLTYGHIIHPANQQIIDEVLLVYMAAPHTYTREDVVEIHCHGSYLILQEVLDLLISAGAQLAQPGEFTKRAFLNGRIDLTQAEAVMELLDAKTASSLDMARQQLSGRLCDQIEACRQALGRSLAILEVAIDFPDEDVDIVQPAAMATALAEEVLTPLAALLAAADSGRIFREGISLVILGRPNVGKSSLLNSLLGEDRAIVTSVPGTTRDTLEELVDIGGIPVRLTDTAGIRQDAGEVEEIGIRRAHEKLAAADLVLVMIDGSVGITEEDQRLANLSDKPRLYAINKIDIIADYKPQEFAKQLADQPLVSISAKKGLGLEELKEELVRLATGGNGWDPGHGAVPNIRHQHALQQTSEATERVIDGLHLGLPADLLAIELQAALDSLGEIIGTTTNEDILDMIFTQFCLGK